MNSRSTQPSRRTLLGMLGAVPLGTGVVLTGAGVGHADDSAATGTSGATAAHGPIPKGLRPGGEYDQLVAKLADEDTFSGVVRLTRRGRPVLERAYGMANKAESVPNRIDTLFDLGSITKCFTAVAVMQLEHQNKLDLHETVGTYLDGFQADVADTVTVHQLLTHTSGLGDYSQAEDFWAESQKWNSFDEIFDGTLDVIRGLPDLVEFTPGTQWRYSNTGFFLLGAIVREVSGQDYYDYIKEHVFRRAGMKRSGFYTKPEVLAADDIARPYSVDRETGERIDSTTLEYFSYGGTPAGGAYSTAGELSTFVQALMDGRTLLPATSVDLTISGKAVLGPDERPELERQNSFYGYGFEVTTLNDHRIRGHSGGSTLGVSTMLDFYPDLDWVAVSLSNYADRYWPMVNLERELITQQ